MQEKIDHLKTSKLNLLNKNQKFLFFIMEAEVNSVAVYEIYNHVKVLREIGYDAKLLTDKNEYKIPDFLDMDLKALPHVSAENQNFQISVEDFVVIPELFANVMEQVKNLPCERIVLLQNFENALRGLLPGVTWLDYNIRNVITTNSKLTDLSKGYLGLFDIQQYKIGIPDYFKLSAKPKTPVITYFTRNSQEFFKVIKLFYLKYPQYRFISFQDLKGSSRTDFAKKIADSFACVWIDEISSFGTVPIEAMKVKTIPIGIIPSIVPEYIDETLYNGLWTHDIFQIPDLIADVIKMEIQNIIPEKVYNDMKTTADKYNIAESKESIIKAYTYFIDKRVNEIQRYIDECEKQMIAEKV
jgi:hypothetical protein